MRSAPFRRIVVADSLGKTFETKKSFENFFDAPVSACACAKVRDQCFWPSSARLCLVKFHRPRLSALHRVPSGSCAMLRRIGTISVGFPQSNSIALCVFICARSTFFMFLRNGVCFLSTYNIPEFTDEKSAQNVLIFEISSHQ